MLRLNLAIRGFLLRPKLQSNEEHILLTNTYWSNWRRDPLRNSVSRLKLKYGAFQDRTVQRALFNKERL
jgi:hypothetical protein